MSKHSGENTLNQIFTNIKEKVDYLKGLIDAKQQPFIITGTADFTTGVVNDVSHTFAEITEAYNRGDHIFFDADISQAVAGTRAFIALSSFCPGQVAVFDQIFDMDGKVHVRACLFANGGTNLILTPLVPQTQIGNLTFVVSSTVPTVDDRSIITFVVEE